MFASIVSLSSKGVFGLELSSIVAVAVAVVIVAFVLEFEIVRSNVSPLSAI